MTARALGLFLLSPCLLALLLVGCSGGKKDDSNLEACNEIVLDGASQRRELQDNAPRACAADEDCVVVYHPSACIAGCTRYVAIAGAAERMLASSVQDVDDEVCAEFFDRGCELPTKACPPFRIPTGATCDDGVCTLQASDW